MTRRKKVSDDMLLQVYQQTKSIWDTGRLVGLCGQSVHERLVRLLGGNLSQSEFSSDQQQKIRDLYAVGFLRGDGKLKQLSSEIGKSVQNISRYARRVGITNAKRKCTAELSESMADRSKQYIKKNGHPRGALGMRHSPETLAKMSAASIKARKERPPEKQAAIVQKILRTKAANGTLYTERKASWKAGWRDIGGKRKFFRSRWEANYARYLQFLKDQKQIMEWEHEPETFWFEGIRRGSCSYLPDFRVTENDGQLFYVEVKGWMDARSKTKLKRMRKYHPNVQLQIVQAKEYQRLTRQCSGLIKDWEL